MADMEELATGFRYDLWANRMWLECLNRKAAGTPDRDIFGHVLSASTIWVTRCEGTSLDHFPIVEQTEEALEALITRWLAVVDKLSANPTIDYKRTSGEAHSSRFSDIVAHVVNHGTYHRGELRGLCLSRGDVDFPETDRIGFTLRFGQ